MFAAGHVQTWYTALETKLVINHVEPFDRAAISHKQLRIYTGGYRDTPAYKNQAVPVRKKKTVKSQFLQTERSNTEINYLLQLLCIDRYADLL